MTLTEHARMLMAYNTWANTTVLDAVQEVSDDDLEQSAGASYDSIQATMRHMVTAQAVWLSRWTAAQPPQYDLQTREGRRAAFHDCDRALEAYCATLTDGDWDRRFEYRDSQSIERSDPLGRMITHVVNHGTLHRGEVGMMLGALGRSPGDLDYVFWARQAAR